MTVQLEDGYEVTVHHGEQLGPRTFRARGEIFRHNLRTQRLHVVFGEGRSMSKADDSCVYAAREWVRDRRGEGAS